MQQKRTNLIIIYFLIAIFLFIATAIIAHFQLDVKFQSHFYNPYTNQVWYQKNAPLWSFLYHYGPVPAMLVALAALFVLVFSKSMPQLRRYKRAGSLFLLAMILGPGLVINGVFKDHWGRPRPRQVVEFGGQWEFRQVWQPGIPGKGKSFPCGHASVGFIFFTLFLALRKEHKKIAWFSLFFSLIYGSLIGVARMAQGGHFFSDVIWAWGFTYLVIMILHFHVLKKSEKKHHLNLEAQGLSPTISKGKRFFMIFSFIILFAFLLFFFLFSKPAYKEFHYALPRADSVAVAKIDFRINQGDLVLVPDSLANFLRVDGTMQGFGFPEFKFENHVVKQICGDTTKLIFTSTLSGIFYEKDIVFTCRFDTNKNVILSGNLKNGNLFLKMNDKIKETTFNEINLLCR